MSFWLIDPLIIMEYLSWSLVSPFVWGLSDIIIMPPAFLFYINTMYFYSCFLFIYYLFLN